MPKTPHSSRNLSEVISKIPHRNANCSYRALSLLCIPKPFNSKKVRSRIPKTFLLRYDGFQRRSLCEFPGQGELLRTIAREIRKAAQLPTTPDAIANRSTRLMKNLFLLVFFAIAVGGVIAASSTNGRPLKPGSVSVRSAAELYSKTCASCHGKDGRAKTFKAKLNHARNLADPEWQGRVSDERLFNSIMNGKGKMPAYGKKFSQQEIDSLVSYVRALRK